MQDNGSIAIFLKFLDFLDWATQIQKLDKNVDQYFNTFVYHISKLKLVLIFWYKRFGYHNFFALKKRL